MLEDLATFSLHEKNRNSWTDMRKKQNKTKSLLGGFGELKKPELEGPRMILKTR